MRLTVCLLVALLVGGAAWWRWSWARWRRALAAEQVGRERERFVAATEYRLLQSSAARVRAVLERHRDGLTDEQAWLDFQLWELASEEDGVE